VAAAAIWAGSFAVLLWASVAIAGTLAAVWWLRVAWRDVAVDIAFEPERAFEHEPIFLRVAVRNDKRVPLPIVRIVVVLPEGLGAERDASPVAFHGFRRRLTVGGSAEVRLRLPVYPAGRGEYWIEPVEVGLADPFDAVTARRRIEVPRPLLVLPQNVGGLPIPAMRRLPFGTPVPAAHLFEDREHFAGVRDYEAGDPMRHVHWRMSAHTGRLQTKRFDPSRSAEVLLALDLSRGEPFWRSVDTVAAETSIGWASAAARQAVSAGWRVGLIANTHLRRGRGPLRVASSVSVGQEAALFAALARMPSQPTVDLAPVVRETARRLTRRCTVVVISPFPGSALLREMEVLRRRGLDVVHLSPPRATSGGAA
jgi:uncharacterized protein (DUF58 family)